MNDKGRLCLVLAIGAGVACSSSGKDDTGSVSEDLGQGVMRMRRAERGLSISPVPLDTRTMDRDQRMKVGLGSYIVNGTSDCSGCHSSEAGFLAGGNPFVVGPAGQVVWSRNLTPDATTGMPYSLAEFKRVMRTGKDLHHDPTKMLIVMPWPYYRWMSDADLEAVYAYLRAILPVHDAVPLDDKHGMPLPPEIPFTGVYDEGKVTMPLPESEKSFDPRRGVAIDPLAASSGLHGQTEKAYGLGSYIANSMTGCNECHTHPDRAQDAQLHVNTSAWLTGGTVYAVPPPLQPVVHQVRSMSANLKGATHGFFNEAGVTYDSFHAIIHTQSHADETPARPLGFPMNMIAANLDNLLDEDLRAIYAYMQLTPDTAGPSDVERQGTAWYCASNTDCGAGRSCATATHECIGTSCSSDVDCAACQTCNAGKCAAPLASSPCVLSAQ